MSSASGAIWTLCQIRQPGDRATVPWRVTVSSADVQGHTVLNKVCGRLDRYPAVDGGFCFPPSGALKGIQRMKTTATLAVRVNRANRNHHLWSNNGTYWCHFTVHEPDFSKRRVRRSLKTSDVKFARQRRDALLASFCETGGQVELEQSHQDKAGFALAA